MEEQWKDSQSTEGKAKQSRKSTTEQLRVSRRRPMAFQTMCHGEEWSVMLLDVPWATHCVIVDSRLHLARGACAINGLSSCDTKQARQDGTIELPDFLIFSLVLVETKS
jgi:hypothetical protein